MAALLLRSGAGDGHRPISDHVIANPALALPVGLNQLETLLQDFLALTDMPGVLKLPGLLDRAIARAYDFAPYTPPFNVTGQPSASVPLHWTSEGLPLGTMITARPGDEKTVLRLAAQLEEAQPWFDRRAPTHA